MCSSSLWSALPIPTPAPLLDGRGGEREAGDLPGLLLLGFFGSINILAEPDTVDAVDTADDFPSARPFTGSEDRLMLSPSSLLALRVEYLDELLLLGFFGRSKRVNDLEETDALPFAGADEYRTSSPSSLLVLRLLLSKNFRLEYLDALRLLGLFPLPKRVNDLEETDVEEY